MIVYKTPYPRKHKEDAHRRVMLNHGDRIRSADALMIRHKKFPQGFALFESTRFGCLIDAFLDLQEKNPTTEAIAEAGVVRLLQAHPDLKG